MSETDVTLLDLDAPGSRRPQALEHRAPAGTVVEIAGHLGVEVPRIHTLHACAEMLQRAQRLGGSERA